MDREQYVTGQSGAGRELKGLRDWAREMGL